MVTDREKISYDPAEMDNAADQIKKIQELHLPVDELDACNLMAFFLGWAMKRGQMSNPFISRYREIVDAVQSGKEPDLRVFILDNLDGKLSTQFFDRRCSGFAQWYAQDNRSNPYVYRRDCRNIVLSRLKYRVWNSIAEKEAAYLLLPYTEKNRQSVEHLLDETDAAKTRLGLHGSPSFAGVKDVSQALDRADHGGVLNTRELLDIAGVLTASRRVSDYDAQRQGDETVLDRLFTSLHTNKYLEEQIRSAILDEETIADTAARCASRRRRAARFSSASSPRRPMPRSCRRP